MKGIISCLMFGLVSVTAAAQPAPWQNPAVSSENREPSRTEFMSYDRRDDAATYNYDKSPFYLPLKGKWTFHLAADASQLKPDFYNSDYAATGDRETDVPGYWASTSAKELSSVVPPMLPAENPIGQYRAQFMVPLMWLDRDIFVHVGGFKSAVTLYINGRKVGYSEDAGTPAEFNISKYIQDGVNTIGLEIPKWADGSWLQNSTLSGAGIEDGVYVYSQPKVHIDDIMVEATLDSLYKNGVMNLDVVVVNRMNVPDTLEVFFDLMDAKGDIVRYNTREAVVGGFGARDTVRFQAIVGNVKQWSPETPNQYYLMLRVRNDGRFTEYIPYKLGFRKTEMKDGIYYLNNKPIQFKGVNYSYNGIAPDDKTMRADLLRLKQHNVNAIKCNYHPRKNRLYELCAEMGLMICDEVNLNSSLTGSDRSVGGTLGNNPQWRDAHMFRVENAYMYNRNHTGVVMWSMGTDAGIGYSVYKAFDKMKSLETKRPIAYAPAKNYWCTDLFFPANPTVATITDWAVGADPRIAVVSDFDPKDAESTKQLWDAINKHPRLQGGFTSGEINDGLKYLYRNRENIAK